MNVLITGGGGYVGAVLAPWLLAASHRVTVFDMFWFGDAYLPADNGHLRIIKGDVRDQSALKKACAGQDAIIWLASLSNNDCCVQHPNLADSVNVRAVAYAAKFCDSDHFIYASSVAGYPAGQTATEETRLEHTTPYAYGKAVSEDVLDGVWALTVVRSASVCGPSPRMRFDLTVNMMVRDAMTRGVITVNGGEQSRSHVHIYDLCEFYKLVLERRAIGTYNVVAENQTVMETAKIVANVTGAKIDVRPRSDNRSYTVSGEKAKRELGFMPQRTVEDAVVDIKAHFETGCWKDALTNQHYMNFADGLV